MEAKQEENTADVAVPAAYGCWRTTTITLSNSGYQSPFITTKVSEELYYCFIVKILLAVIGTHWLNKETAAS